MKQIISAVFVLQFFALFVRANAQVQVSTHKKKNPSSFFNKLDHLSFAVSNSHTAMPFNRFSALFMEDLHPGLEIGTGLIWKEKRNHAWIQTFKLGYSYHRFVQHTALLYTETGYRVKFPAGFYATAKLGFGYMHSKEDSEVFVLTKEGRYDRSPKFGRSHAMSGLTTEISKKIEKDVYFFLGYQQRLQFGFIDAYVPMLPGNIILIGASIPVF